MLAELRGNTADDLPVEQLLSDLIADQILLLPDPSTPTGAMTETARAVLIEMRDVIRDQDVASALRFQVSGNMLGRAPVAGRPAAPMLGAAPNIGPGHQGDYDQIGAGA